MYVCIHYYCVCVCRHIPTNQVNLANNHKHTCKVPKGMHVCLCMRKHIRKYVHQIV